MSGPFLMHGVWSRRMNGLDEVEGAGWIAGIRYGQRAKTGLCGDARGQTFELLSSTH
jgi:hypothetical protein